MTLLPGGRSVHILAGGLAMLGMWYDVPGLSDTPTVDPEFVEKHNDFIRSLPAHRHRPRAGRTPNPSQWVPRRFVNMHRRR